MRIRAELHVNGGSRRLLLAAGETESFDHLALKLGACLLLWEHAPVVDAGPRHPALAGQEFRPDLLGVDGSGVVSLWVECGNTSLHKLSKVLRRWPGARVLLLQEGPVQARRWRELLAEDPKAAGRVEILCWPEGGFREWRSLLEESTEAFGESGPTSFNLVVNRKAYVSDLLRV